VNKIKDQLFDEINRRILRKKEMALRAIERNKIESFVLEYINNIEDIKQKPLGSDHVWLFCQEAEVALRRQVQSFDHGANVEVSWTQEENPQVNGVLIKWSNTYQQKHCIEPELFIDITSLLFK
jgi:hypothetical protein